MWTYESPSHSWKSIFPIVVSAVKFGKTSPSLGLAILHLRSTLKEKLVLKCLHWKINVGTGIGFTNVSSFFIDETCLYINQTLY